MTKEQDDEEAISQTPPDCGKCGAGEKGIHGVPIQVGGRVKDVNLCENCLDEIQRGGGSGG